MTSTASVARPGTLCAATRRDGGACCAYALHGSAYCFAHDPSKAGERFAARSAGGRARHGRTLGAVAGGGQGVTLGSVGDVVALLEVTVRDVLGLENSVSRARAIGFLAGIALRGLEAGELEDRIGRLEDKIGL